MNRTVAALEGSGAVVTVPRPTTWVPSRTL